MKTENIKPYRLKPESLRCVFRNHIDRWYQVRISASFSVAGERISALFTDNAYGGKTKALAAAVTFRDQHERKAPYPGVRAQNRSRSDGLPTGVLLSGDIRKNGKVEWHWAATWCKDKAQRRKRFAVNAYGYERAYLLAAKYREKMTGIVVVEPCPPYEYLLERQRKLLLHHENNNKASRA